MERLSLKLLFPTVFILGIIAQLSADTMPEECGTGKKLLFYKTSKSVDSLVNNRFSDDFFDALNTPLREIGYCPVFFDQTILTDTTKSSMPVLYVTIKVDSTKVTSLLVNLQNVRDFSGMKPANLSVQPLISLALDSSDISTFIAVAVRKTIENLRTQYICHLRLESNPSGVLIKSSVGLEGVTPLEWVIPVGELRITGKAEKYALLVRTLDLRNPGTHTYVLDLHKKQFYTSKFIYPTIALGISSAVLYGFERYYYAQYNKYSRDEYFNSPEKFGKTFNTAKTLESATIAALVLTGASFTLCFLF